MKEKIIEILNGIRPEFDYSEDVNYLDEGMLDSFDLVNLVMELNNHFGIEIDGMDILPDNFGTIDDMVNLVKKYQSK
jgi:acyl carrier protein